MNSDMPETQNNPEEQPVEPQESSASGFDLNIGGASNRTRAGASTAEAPQPDPSASEESSSHGGPQNSATGEKRSTHQPPPRRPRSERRNSFNAVAWLAEGALGMLEELRHNDLGLPAEFWTHAYAARREGLLAARTLLDHLVECNEQKGASSTGGKQRQQRRGPVQVE